MKFQWIHLLFFFSFFSSLQCCKWTLQWMLKQAWLHTCSTLSIQIVHANLEQAKQRQFPHPPACLKLNIIKCARGTKNTHNNHRCVKISNRYSTSKTPKTTNRTLFAFCTKIKHAQPLASADKKKKKQFWTAWIGVVAFNEWIYIP